MDIKIIPNFFSKTALADFKKAFDEPKWSLQRNVSVEAMDGAGVVRNFGKEDGTFYLSLFPVHIISRELHKEYYCHRMRLRVTWPNENAGTAPHIDCESSDQNYNITAIIYLYDSDGDLIIYDSIGPEPFNSNAKCKKITPKANTCVLMLKKYYHHAMRPVNSPLRYSININLREFV